MNNLPGFRSLLLATAFCLCAACSSKKDDPAPATPTSTPALSPTQALLVGRWAMESQIFATQPSASQSQSFGPLYSYPLSGSLATSFEFRADGTAAYTAGASVGGPGPGVSANAPYTVVGTSSPTSSAYITFGLAPAQILNINILTARQLVIDKRTVNTDGSISTEQRRFLR